MTISPGWQEAEVITAHHLSAVALDMIESKDPDEVPIDSGVVAVLRAGARRDAMLTISTEGAAASALRSLTERGIQFVVIKGPAAARFHPDPAKRTYSDLDLIVSPRRFRAATDVLVELGYVRNPDSEQQWATFDRHCTEGFNFHRSPTGNVDLHHHVSPWRFGKELDFRSLLRRSDPGKVAGVPVRFASAKDTLVISCLHVVNDLGKDTPSFNSWRDVAILFDHLGPRNALQTFEDAGLSWFAAYIWARLADFGAGAENAEIQGSRRRLRYEGERLRLELMGWNDASLLARHPLGWALRLPAFRALLFLVGVAVPSTRYIHARYPSYRAYWHDAWWSVSAAVHGSDFRHKRISRVSGFSGISLPSDDLRGND